MKFGLRSMVVSVLLCCAVFVLAPVRADAYEVLTPPIEEKPLVNARRAVSHLVVKAADKNEAGQIKVVRLIDRQDDNVPVNPSGSWEKDGAVYSHYELPLKKGTNKFVINPGEQILSVRYKPLRTLLKLEPDNPNAYLFHRNEVVPEACGGCHTEKLPDNARLDVQQLSKNADFSPVCYSCHRDLTSGDKWLHSPAASVACMTCHRRGEGNRKITMLTGRVDDTCFTCHINKRKWQENSHVHGPVGTGDCTVCHDPHGGEFRFMLWADPKIDICIACHTDKKEITMKKNGFVEHGIISGNGCASCHSPHASDYRFQLNGEINDVCVSCHVKMRGIESGHPVGMHPLSGVLERRRQGRELACSSCHNPHGEKYQYLLIGSMLGGHVCSKCHN